MISLFCPQSQLTFPSLVNGAFRQRASVNGAVRDHLSVDHFTALSIAANSCLSSLERAHLLITMGFMLSKTRDWKFGRWNFAEIRGASDAALTGGVGCWGYGLFGDRCRTLGFGCRRHGCGGVVVASGSIDSSQPLAHARGSGRGRAEAVGDAIVGAPAVGEWLLRADQSIRANRLLTRRLGAGTGRGCRRRDCGNPGCGGVVVASGSIDSSQPLAHARGSGRGRADSPLSYGRAT